jgi:hypothetical protein
MRRRRGPGLVGTMARTAVVAGTASAVAGGVHHRQQNRWDAKEQQSYESQQQAEMQAQMNAMQAQQAQQAMVQAAPAAASAGLSPDAMAKLQQLAQLKDQGILTQEEFDRQKMLLLG